VTKFFIRQQMVCNATSQVLLVSTYVKGNLIHSSTKKISKIGRIL